MLTILANCVIAVLILVLSVWILSLILKDVSIVDIVWGLGFVLIAWVAYFSADRSLAPKIQQVVLPMMVTIWGVRLSAYLYWRNHSKPEDYRYQAMRNKWGNSFWWVSLFTVFLLQGILMWIVALPVQVSIATPTSNTTSVLATGLIVWAIGFVFESVGDFQLARFKSVLANRGKVLDQGLWRYTRHPNYFGNFMIWWGIFLVAISQHPAWWTIVGPIVMTILLMKISGVALLEKALVTTKPEYASYIQTTNAFFPWFPKRN